MGAKKKARSRQKQAVRDACLVEVTPVDKENKGHLFQPGDSLEKYLVMIHTCKKQNSKPLNKVRPR